MWAAVWNTEQNEDHDVNQKSFLNKTKKMLYVSLFNTFISSVSVIND